MTCVMCENLSILPNCGCPYCGNMGLFQAMVTVEYLAENEDWKENGGRAFVKFNGRLSEVMYALWRHPYIGVGLEDNLLLDRFEYLEPDHVVILVTGDTEFVAA